ncbi:PREDICTED: sodium-dependent glucose transporter 1-like [Branchiostoma belcheri]|uniref:Sodium-dependent glucose transporter 1-like n=1 Tax=Branchiostoma belcheri TaxID=7741 RepID=A0A6P5A5N0_BRABE|nr:PREDICTED: sodium-dependent glucose transporter 1-like [Branchiostoma belcheri]
MEATPTEPPAERPARDETSPAEKRVPTVSTLVRHVRRLPQYVRDYRVIRTTALFFAWFCMGLYVRIVGPTMIDLKDRLGVDYEEISRVLVSHTVGYFLSTVSGGIFLDFQPKYSWVILGFAFMAAGLGTAGTPFTTTLWGLGFLQHLAGWGHGFTDAAGSVVCVRLWGEKASAPMHAMHSGYPIGAFIIPLIAIPFLSPDRPPADANGTTPAPPTVEEAWLLSSVQWPYVGVSVLQFIIGFVFFYFQYRELATYYDRKQPEKSPKSFSAFVSPSRFLEGQGRKAVFLLVCLFLFYTMFQFNQNPFTQYMVSYMVETGMYTKPEASVVYSTFWICYASMRWLSIAIAAWVPIHVMLSVEITGLCISGVVLAAWGATDKTVFWAFTCILGLFSSSVFPGGTAWANRYLDASSVVFAICVVGASVGSTAANYVTGYLFEYVGPRAMLYFFMSCGCALLVVFAVMQVSVSPLFAGPGPSARGETLEMGDRQDDKDAKKDNERSTSNI